MTGVHRRIERVRRRLRDFEFKRAERRLPKTDKGEPDWSALTVEEAERYFPNVKCDYCDHHVARHTPEGCTLCGVNCARDAPVGFIAARGRRSERIQVPDHPAASGDIVPHVRQIPHPRGLPDGKDDVGEVAVREGETVDRV